MKSFARPSGRPDTHGYAVAVHPIYEAQPGGMRLFNAVLVLLTVTTVAITGILLVFVDAAGALITLVSLLATLAFVSLILPRRYEVWPDRLRIVFPAWSWNIEYAGIESVRPGRWYEAYGFWGMRFATAPSQTVTILRHNANMFTHPNLVISPEDREEFLRRLERAMHTG